MSPPCRRAYLDTSVSEVRIIMKTAADKTVKAYGKLLGVMYILLCPESSELHVLSFFIGLHSLIKGQAHQAVI